MLSAQKRVRDDNDDEADYAYFRKHKEEICRIIAERREKEALRREKEAHEASLERQRERNARKEEEREKVIRHLVRVLGQKNEKSSLFKGRGGDRFFYNFLEACYQLWKYLPDYLGQMVLLKLKPKTSFSKNEYFLISLTDELSESATTLPLCAKLVTKAVLATKKATPTTTMRWRNLAQTEFKVSESDEGGIESEGQIMDTMPVTINGKTYKLKEVPLFIYDTNEHNSRIMQAYANMDGSKAKIVLKKEGHKPVRCPDYSEEEEEEEEEQDDLYGDYSPRSPQYSPPKEDD